MGWHGSAAAYDKPGTHTSSTLVLPGETMQLRSLLPQTSLRPVEGSEQGPRFLDGMDRKLRGCCKVSEKDCRTFTISAPPRALLSYQ